MSMYTRVSEKGQVVVPKAMRDLKGWLAGTDLEVIDAGDGILLRPRSVRKGLSVEDAAAGLRRLYQHKGPPIPVERLSWSADLDDDDDHR